MMALWLTCAGRRHCGLAALESFRDPEAYHATLAHEFTHCHSSRLNRALGQRFGEEAYAMENLVGELGAALRADLIWFPEPREDHASYCELDRSSQRAIFAVSSQAQRAADYLNGLQPVRC
jgi:antirestriction protein ArdC